MTQIERKKDLLYEYFKIAFDIYKATSMVDDYTICTNSPLDFNDIASYKLPVINFTKELVDRTGGDHVDTDRKHNITIFDYGHIPLYQFSFLIAQNMNFSGTIGIKEINRDFGLSRHLEYLSVFIEEYKINNLFHSKDLDIYGEDSDELMDSYRQLYDVLEEYFTLDSMSLYSLLNGIKNQYKVPDNAILLEGDSYTVLDMKSLRSHIFINEFGEKVSCISSKTSPMLKISFNGNKILHIRTKLDKKNNTFKLRFFIETTSKFLNLFKTKRII